MIDPYFLNRHVVIFPYDPIWPRLFETEKNKISKALNKQNFFIEHIGSTAVPNLASKPIIDIMVGIEDLAIADRFIQPLERIEYEYVQELERHFPDRRFFHRGPNQPNQHFHLHMVLMNSPFWNEHLFFRNYLRSHEKALKNYQQLKESLAKKYQHDVQGYTNAKTAFIQDIVNHYYQG